MKSSKDAELAILTWELEQMYQASPRSLEPAWVHKDVGSKWDILSYISAKEPSLYMKALSVKDKRVFFGIICKEKGTEDIYYVLRGTENLAEWWTDAKVGFRYTSMSDCLSFVETGFYEIASSLQESPVSNLVFDNITYVGHSLGGAVAALKAVGHRGSTLITFGCPHIGNVHWAKNASATISPDSRMYVYLKDIVPTLPPSPYMTMVNNAVYLPKPTHPLAFAPVDDGLTGSHSALMYAWLIDNNVSLPYNVPRSAFEKWIDEVWNMLFPEG